MAIRSSVHYGKISLPEIRNVGDIVLNETRVQGTIEGYGTFSACRATTLASVDVSGKVDIVLSHCKVVETNGSITALFSTISALDAFSIRVAACQIGQLRACEEITAIACRQLGSVNSVSGTTTLLGVEQVTQVCGQDVLLRQTKVIGDVLASRNVDISDSTIEGTLRCAPDHLIVIRNSNINTIVFNLKTFKKNSTTLTPSLKLINCQVQDIIFHGHGGKVMFSNNSIITGKITTYCRI